MKRGTIAALGLACALMVGGAVVALGAPSIIGGGTVAPHAWMVIGSTPDHQHLVLQTDFGGVASNCSRFEGWTVVEDANEVTVEANLWSRSFASSCTSDGASEFLELDLTEPLGDRRLIGCGQQDCLAPVSPFVQSRRIEAIDVDVVVVGSGERVAAHSATEELWSVPSSYVFEMTQTDHGVLVEMANGAQLIDKNGTITWADSFRVGAVDDDKIVGCTSQQEDQQGVTLFDLATTNPIWTVSALCGAMTLGEDTVVIIANDFNVDGGMRLVVLDRETGEERVDRVFDDGIDDQVEAIERVTLASGFTVASGFQANLVVIDREGIELHRVEKGVGEPIGELDGSALIAGPRKTMLVDPVSGELVWEVIGMTQERLALSDVGLFHFNEETDRLERIDSATGLAVWSTSVGVSASLDIAATDNTVFVKSSIALHALDAQTGEVRWWKQLAYKVG